MITLRACVLMACSAMLAGCGGGGVPVNGSGTIKTEARTVSGFSAVSLSGSGEVVIEQTGADSLTVTADDNLLSEIKSDVHGNTLELGPKALTNLQPTRDIVFRVTVKKLEGLTVSGSGHADAKGLNADRLGVEISGSGVVSAQGTAGDLDVSVSGSGRYEGDALTSRRATVNVSGSGGVVVAPSDALEANVSGSGTVGYVGDPRVTQQVSGSGSVRRTR